MAEKISVLISEEEVAKRIREIAEQISKDYEGKQVHMICILKGGVFFMTELSKHVTVPWCILYRVCGISGGAAAYVWGRL